MSQSLALPVTTSPAGLVAPKTGQHERGAAWLRRAFHVHLHGDIHERASDWGLKLPIGAKRRARLQAIRDAGALFIHVPKNAGTSIASRLYGGSMRHETIRYYRHAGLDPAIPSFAIWRDPVERFCSAFDFSRQGGGRNVRLHEAFSARYRAFSSLDQALNHLETLRSPYEADYVFRPQSWFVCDRAGQLAVDHLFSLASVADLPRHVPALAGHVIPHLNDSMRVTHVVTEQQKTRIKRLYSSDYALEQLISYT